MIEKFKIKGNKLKTIGKVPKIDGDIKREMKIVTEETCTPQSFCDYHSLLCLEDILFFKRIVTD